MPRFLPKIFRSLIIQAPMAGGITTPKLVAAVSNQGAIGSLATGYLKTDAVQDAVQAIKALTKNPFSINVFIPDTARYDLQELQAYQKQMNIFRHALGLPAQTALPDSLQLEDNLEELVNLAIREKIAIFSFTFGRLPEDLLRRLKENQILVIGTATTPKEASLLERDGVDAIVAQGLEAGGHRGGFLPGAEQDGSSTLDLISACLRSTDTTPIIAAGGIMTGRDIQVALDLGASAVQMGTAFLATQESGAHSTYKAHLLLNSQKATDPTVLTTVYSGKMARGLETEFIRQMRGIASIPAYPAPHILSAPIRKAASLKNNPEYMSHWSGQGIQKLTYGLTVQELIEKLMQEMNDSPTQNCL